MSKKKLLFITEGENDEPKFINKFFAKCYPNVNYDFYVYQTDIHTLARYIFDGNNNIDEYLDIKNVLKEKEKNEYKISILSKTYTDIIMVFDFDPQSSRTEFEKIYKMLKFFNDPTNNGKLYINYPMMQAYRHICSYPEEDNGFKEREVKSGECGNYKDIVNRESCIKNLNKYTYPIIMKIIGYQLKKANFIANQRYEIPEHNELHKIDLNQIYRMQCKKNEDEKSIYILNTFIFHLIEYNTIKMLDNIKNYN